MRKQRRLRARKLQRGPNGRFRCRWCDKEVNPPRQTFCNDSCVHEWNIRRNAGYVRDLVRARDHGVCAMCSEDTIILYNKVQDIMNEHGRKGRKIANAFLSDNGWKPIKKLYDEGQYWQADHIIAVANGGGLCGLDNFETLCSPCHKRKTKVEGATRRLIKKNC